MQVYNVSRPQYEQRGKYKRSTNNSHKKFISVARKLLFKICSEKERGYFEKEFEIYKNSRTFYFIILAHVKIRMNKDDGKRFTTAFVLALNRKMQIYNNQIRNTHNSNFIHFRFEEISDIQFAIKAMELYFNQKIEEAIETVYRKDRLTLFKRQQYDVAVKTIFELEKKLKAYPPGPLFPCFLQDQKSMQNVSRKLPNEMLRQFPSVSEHKKQKRKKSSDEEWMGQEDNSSEPKKKINFRRRRFQERMGKKQNRFQQPIQILQSSYPIFPDFYQIMFNYEITNPYPMDPATQFSSKMQLPSVMETNRKIVNPEQCLMNSSISKNLAHFQLQQPNLDHSKRLAFQNQQTFLKNEQHFDFASKFTRKFFEDVQLKMKNRQHSKIQEAQQ